MALAKNPLPACPHPEGKLAQKHPPVCFPCYHRAYYAARRGSRFGARETRRWPTMPACPHPDRQAIQADPHVCRPCYTRGCEKRDPEYGRYAYSHNLRRAASHARRYKYQMGDAEYERFVSARDGCDICGKPWREIERKFVRKDGARSKRLSLCIDHDHTTGLVRGALCIKCNLDIGRIEKNGRREVAGRDSAWVDNALIYLGM